MMMLPALAAPWPGTDSLFAGIGIDGTGTPYALLLAAIVRKCAAHYTAENLAIEHGALLPTRLDGAMLRAALDFSHFTQLDLPKNSFAFWLAERAEPTFGHANAWAQTLTTGCQWSTHVGTERTAVLLVHRMPLQILGFSAGPLQITRVTA